MRRSLPVAAVLAAALTVAACGGSSSSTGGSASTTGGPAVTTTSGSTVSGDPSVAWVDKVCGEIVKLTQTQTTAPPNLSNSDANQALEAFDQYIGANIDVVDKTISNLRNVGPSPIAGADEALTALLNGLEALKKGYQTTREMFSKVDPNNPQAAQAAMLEAFSGLSQGGEELGKAVDTIDSNKAIENAGKQAPNCQKLDAGTSTTTTS